jgi:hypothetical protein
MLKLFLLRRCTFELDPDPSYPGCVYSEMKMCLAPCFKGCTDERYAEESAAVENFLATRGESRLVILRSERDQASADLAFESAATLHAQIQRVEAVHALAAELVRPLSKLRAVILQACANPDEVAVFLFENGSLRGPAAFSILGMRIQNEQSGSTSLFAQPLVIEPILERTEIREQRSESTDQQTEIREQRPETDQVSSEHEVSGHDFSRAGSDQPKEWASAPEAAPSAPRLSRGVLESRLEAAFAALTQNGSGPAAAPSSTVRQGHLALLKRWYYRPEAKRAGEIFFPDSEDHWPIKAILRGIGRVAAKSIFPPPQS